MQTSRNGSVREREYNLYAPQKNLGVTRMMMKAALVFYSHLPNLQYLINILFYYFIKNNK